MTESIPTAIIKTKQTNRFSLTWLVPFVAVVATTILFVQWKLNQGPLITITFDDANGSTSESPILYRGTVVGRVNHIHLDEDLEKVLVTARLDSSAAMLAKENSKWWIVRPTVSLQGIQGLDTILGPRYIQVAPGNGNKTYAFTGAPEPLNPEEKQFVLITSSAEAVTVGAPIFYRGIEIGNINSVQLADNAATVQLTCNIQQRYTPLIRTNTKFWNISGIRIDANLLGIDLKAGPLTSWIKGGVSLATPNIFGDIAPTGYAFILEDKVEDEWLEWSPEIDLTQEIK
jgi:paraquat-inducible protein B